MAPGKLHAHVPALCATERSGDGGTPSNATGRVTFYDGVTMLASTLPGYLTAGAASAVDGNTDGSFFDGSVTHTNLDINAWWEVDLGASAIINSIVVWNRTDCCSSRLNNYWVFVSDTPFGPNDTPATLQNRPGTFSSNVFGFGSNPRWRRG